MRNNTELMSSRLFVGLSLILVAITLIFTKPLLAATGNPVVLSTNPTDKQESINVNLPIYITFDREMDAATMTSTNIIIQDNQAQVVPARGIHYDSPSKTTVFIPLAPLKEDETYQMTIKTGVQDINALSLLQDYSVSFKTSSSATSPEPLVTSTIPKESVSQIGTKRVISASFNHDMNPNTINNLTFLVVDQNSNSVAAKSITYDSSSRIVAFVPVSPLNPNTKYTVTLKGGASGSVIKDSGGVSLAKDYSWSFTTGNTEFNDPHGNYMQNTNLCSTCHQTHNALNTSLLNKSTETALCFTCHDGSGSNYNVSTGMTDTTNNKSFHPIMDTGNLQNEQLFQCSDCHDPHGNKDAQGNYYAKLLKVTDGTTTIYQGNAFCLICHGSTDRKFTTSYFNDTAGDHTNSIAAHFDTTKTALDSPTKITCSKCHTSHSGKYGLLTDQLEENLCLSCHNNPSNSHSGQGNIQEQFFGSSVVSIVSKHDITSSDGGKVECSSCHGSHTVGAASLSEGKAFSDLSDPQNTKNVFTIVAGTPNATVGNMSDFCLRCHGNTPPTAARSLTQVVPFTIIFPQLIFSNGSGWNKSSFLSSTHSLYGIGCEKCHESHGSQYPSLQSRGEDTTSTSGECLTCHASVGNELNQTSHHPTLEISGKHTNTETTTDKFDTTQRHAECVDCHDPHSPSKVVAEGNQLCLQCHESSKYTGSAQNGSVSGFSDTSANPSSLNSNLHLIAQHSAENCNVCHVSSAHGSSHNGLLALTSEDVNSKISVITTVDGQKGYSGYWVKDSCTTCHTS